MGIIYGEGFTFNFHTIHLISKRISALKWCIYLWYPATTVNPDPIARKSELAYLGAPSENPHSVTYGKITFAECER